ncbi:MAG: ribosomal protein S18-alanine N-acetyltransferase [bacterium]|nr:ribosomal protein S18-alanine N-acetyltransferase [bacterium]
MIQELAEKDIVELEKRFPQVFSKDSVKKRKVDNSFTKYFTYKIDDRIVAFINYDIIYERAELININVIESYQNHHIGSKLIEYMIKDCTRNKVNSITLEVKINNRNAIHLYKKKGFVEVAIRKGYYQGIDAVLMEKEVSK